MKKIYITIVVVCLSLSGTAFSSCGKATTALPNGEGCSTRNKNDCTNYYMNDTCINWTNRSCQTGDIACIWDGEGCTDGGARCPT